MVREGECTAGLSPVAADDGTTFQALSTFARRRPAHVLMDCAGGARWRRRLFAGLLEVGNERRIRKSNLRTHCNTALSAQIALHHGAEDVLARERCKTRASARN